MLENYYVRKKKKKADVNMITLTAGEGSGRRMSM